MTKSVYVIGGAGTGKSTFTQELMDRMGIRMGPLLDLFQLANKKALVTLRGHRVYVNSSPDLEGIYLGLMRDSFPGTDGLDRASSPVGEAWLLEGQIPDLIISEGSTLATRRFISALNSATDLLLVHLHAEEFVKDLRFASRGSNQDPSFILSTETRSSNLLKDMGKIGVTGISVDTVDQGEWESALQDCLYHLKP